MSTLTPLEIVGKATLKHVNLRKEGNEDNRERAADLKIVVVTGSELLLAFSPTIRMFFFNQDGSLRHPAVKQVEWDGDVRSMVLSIMQPDRAPTIFTDVKLKGFVFEARKNWGLVLTMSAQLHPKDGDAETFHRLLLEEFQIDCRRDGDLIDQATGEILKAAKGLHDMAKKDGGQVTLSTPSGPSVTFGALTPSTLTEFREAGKAEAAKHEEDRDFDRGFAMAGQKYGKAFVEEYLTELEGAYSDGWESVPT